LRTKDYRRLWEIHIHDRGNACEQSPCRRFSQNHSKKMPYEDFKKPGNQKSKFENGNGKFEIISVDETIFQI